MPLRYQLLFGFAIGFALWIVLGGVKYFQIQEAIKGSANFGPPPESVTTTTVKLLSWTNDLPAVGSVVAAQGVQLASEVAGTVTKINFNSGQLVSSGEALIELDTSVERASLDAANAALELAKQNAVRKERLFKEQASSQADLDKARAELRGAVAAARSIEAGIAKKQIVAPFAGRLGIREVNIGTYVSPGTVLVPLYASDPMFINFTLPQRVLSLIKVGAEVVLTSDALPVEKPFKAAITSIDPNIDEATRTFRVQATANNGDGELKPGMFVKVAVNVGEPQNYLTIPATSISYAPYGDSVYVVEELGKPDGTKVISARQQFVKVGSRRGDQVAIVSGLKEGEQIASGGVSKLRPGAIVNVSSESMPSFDANPTPENS